MVFMKRTSVTLTDSTQQVLDDYLSSRPAAPSLSTLINVALTDYISRQKLMERGYRAAQGELNLPISDAEVEPDVSINHDDYV